MSKQTQLQSIEMKQRKKCHGNRKLQRFRKRCRRNRMNHPLMEVLMTSHAVIRQFHPNDHESNEEEEEEEEEKEQIDNNVRKNFFIKTK
jgi:hypothetical protein